MRIATCNVAQINGPFRCDLPFDHAGDHQAFGQSWPNRRDKPTRALGGRTTTRQRRMRPVSESQQADVDVLTGIMAERVSKEFDRFGSFECECASIKASDSERGLHRWCGRCEKSPQTVLDNWHPHHIEKRRKGPKANRRNVFRSRSRPDNVAIVHPACHVRVESAPEWSEGGS